MAAAVDSLAGLSLNAGDPMGLVAARRRKEQALLDMKRSMELQAGDPKHVFSGATNADIADEEASLADSPDFGTEEQNRLTDIQNTNDELSTYNRPDVTAQRQGEFANKLALASAPADVAAKGNLAVEEAKTRGALAEKSAQTEATQKLLEAIGGRGAGGQSGAGLAGPGGTIKPTINAAGGVSFTTTAMPALVQRARNQLMDARDKTLNALQEAEKQYPGIFEEATKVDEAPAGGSALGRLFTGLTGIGGTGKYSGPGARFNAGVERGNYTLGIPTPFSKLAQEASFGNIEQMAGQLPGVRGLATITPLFKEHQSRWGHEAPTASVQRLKHMVELMNETLTTLDTSGQGQPEQ